MTFLSNWARVLLTIALGAMVTALFVFAEADSDQPGEEFLSRFYPNPSDRPVALGGLFPCYPAVSTKQGFRQLAGVQVNTPYFYANGRKHFVTSRDSIVLIPDIAFLQGNVELTVNNTTGETPGALLTQYRPTTQWISIPYLPDGVKRALPVSFELTPDVALQNPFAAVIFHDDDFNSEIFWKELGPMEAGKTYQVDLVTDPIPRSEDYPHSYILLFDRGYEIPTPRRLEIGSSLAALCFKWVHDHNRRYRIMNLEKDLPVLPIFQAAASLKVQGEFVTGETRLHAKVDEFGFLQDAEIVETTNEKLEAPAKIMVNRWLFFPRMEAGEFRESWVAIPLVFTAKNEPRIGK